MEFGYIYARILPDGTKERAKTAYTPFENVQKKFEFLIENCKDGMLCGVPASELLTFGGTKDILWIDIDSKNVRAFREWTQRPEFPFPPGSYTFIPSATGNIHVYVSCDRALRKDECFSFAEWFVERAPEALRFHVDKVCGPENLETIFLPFAAIERATYPQKLLEGYENVFTLPELEGSVFEEWKKRRTIASSRR